MIIITSTNMSNFPWWVILIIIFAILILYFLIPWKKIYSKNKDKSDLINEPKEYLDKNKNTNLTKNIANPQNKPMLGIYNWFGKKEALRLKTLIYVKPEEDSCELCIPFENKILSLEPYDNKYLTMSEAISKGYHHIGCKHKDLDYFPGSTKIKENRFTIKEQSEKHSIVLGLYKLENDIRNLKYEFDNVKQTDKLNYEIILKSEEIHRYCLKNNLIRNSERENPNISDLKKFS
ncbi:hypothetical protein [Spiroplasma monobiae]|uniref:Transmembrane protein n=1 Tax=Spiroplasma monobiae MQ-1 TaxID=1336748 RepID=A0A2K9LTS5_SPISQ|nr:hypothetical protein [Spiroplasma monobiae]AUM62447.1 hypothetical protein SMONO_v1c01960 [Spiroplasma monobiae MQ-1]